MRNLPTANTQYEEEMGNRFNIRIEGTRIKHKMGPVSLKLYDKFGLILRIETTVNDLTLFKHYRGVEHRDGGKETKWASMQKTIYSLPALREILEAAKRRYLRFLSAIEDPRNGRDNSMSVAAGPTKADPTLDSICSTPTTTPCSAPSREASSTSAACKITLGADSCPTKTAARCPDCSSASEFTVLSKRSATPTSST